VVEAKAKCDANEVKKRRLEEQSQAKEIAADAKAERVVVEGEAKSEAKEVERQRLEVQAEVNVVKQLSQKQNWLESW
jgi:hypothetical protein